MFKNNFNLICEGINPNIIKFLEKHIDVGGRKWSSEVAKLSQQIPVQFKEVSGYLYRGMVLDQIALDKLKTTGLVLEQFSSWTTSPEIAKRFSVDPKLMMKNKTGTPVVFKKKIPKSYVIVNIQSFVLFLDNMGMINDFDPIVMDSAIKEQEILIEAGIRLFEKDVM